MGLSDWQQQIDDIAEEEYARRRLRDQFAMAALPGLAVHAGYSADAAQQLADRAYQVADAMLMRREQSEPAR